MKKTGFGHVLLFLNPNLRGGSPEKCWCPKKFFAPPFRNSVANYNFVKIPSKLPKYPEIP
jgi:hypothetical protein